MLENSSSSSGLSRRIGYALLAITWVVGAYFLSTIAMVVMVRVLVLAGVPLAALSANVLVFVTNALIWGIMLLLLMLPLKRIGVTSNIRQHLGLDRLLSWGDIGLAVIAFIPYLILSGLLGWVVMTLLPGYDAGQVQDVGFSDLTNRSELILAFVALVIAAPVIEEVIFRGFLFARLRKHLGVIVAMLLTSLTFAVLHMQLNVGIDVFALSLVLCTLRLVTGSIWAGIILHMTKNAVAFFILFVYPMIQ